MATVRIPPVLRPQTGGKPEVDAGGSTVGEVLRALTAEHPDTDAPALRRRRRPQPLRQRLSQRRGRAGARRARDRRLGRRHGRHPAGDGRRPLVPCAFWRSAGAVHPLLVVAHLLQQRGHSEALGGPSGFGQQPSRSLRVAFGAPGRQRQGQLVARAGQPGQGAAALVERDRLLEVLDRVVVCGRAATPALRGSRRSSRRRRPRRRSRSAVRGRERAGARARSMRPVSSSRAAVSARKPSDAQPGASSGIAAKSSAASSSS